MEYKVRQLGKICAQSGAPLKPGAPCYSVLVERNGQLERLDYNVDSWQGPPENTVGFWKCLVPIPEHRKVGTVDPEMLMRLFEQLFEEQQPAREKLLYVLALFLLQRRRLRLERSILNEDGEFLELVGTRGEGPFEVRDQQLADEEIKALQAALEVHLNSDCEAA